MLQMSAWVFLCQAAKEKLKALINGLQYTCISIPSHLPMPSTAGPAHGYSMLIFVLCCFIHVSSLLGIIRKGQVVQHIPGFWHSAYIYIYIYIYIYHIPKTPLA